MLLPPPQPPNFVRLSLLWLGMSIAACHSAAAVTVGLVDDFQDGTVQDWSGSPTSNIADAGPAGTGDNALRVNSTNRIVVYNVTQWTGDYIAAGVKRIAMDIRQANSFPFELRIALASGELFFGGSGDTYVTNYTVNVPNDGQWRHIEFSVTPVDFVPSLTTTNRMPDAAAALANVTHLRLLHNPMLESFVGATGPAVFFLDNIVALGDAPTADFNADGQVDGADFLRWQQNLGAGTIPAEGDADGNGLVDGADLELWKNQFGAPEAAAVPEPHAASMLIGPLAALFIRLNRRTRLAKAMACSLSENRRTLVHFAQSREQIVPDPFRGRFSDKLLV
jgi:hypothetical protein